MNRWQKIAWFNLIVITVSLSFSGGAVTIIALIAGFPIALCGLGFLGMCGIMGLTPLFFRKKEGQVDADERDHVIQRKSLLTGYIGSYGFFVIVCMGTWIMYRPKGVVSVNMLPIVVCGGLITMELFRSIALLVQYGRGGKDGQE